MLNTPLLVPPPCISIVPAFTFTVPVLLNCVEMAVVVFDSLVKTPLLLKTPPPLPTLMALSNVLASVKVPVLLKALAPDMLMALLLAAVLPDQRSEERRVGREGGCGWSPSHLMTSVVRKVRRG